MNTNDNHFVFAQNGEYFILSPEETFTMVMRGMKREPLNLAEFSKPLDRHALCGFVSCQNRPVRLEGSKLQCDSFWELFLELLCYHNVASALEFKKSK